MKFEILEQLISQKERMNEAHLKMAQRWEDAKAEIEVAKKEYEEAITQQVVTGKDLTAQLDIISEKIKTLEEAASRRKQELDVFSSLKPGEEITSEDVINAWNDEFVATYRKEKFDAIMSQLFDAKKAYVLACLAYEDSVKEFEDIRNQCRGELADENFYKLKGIEINTRDQREKYMLSLQDLIALSEKDVPISLRGLM